MFQELIKKIAQSLNKRDILYMLIGGQAVLLYGTPRLTKDIDITLGVSIDRLPEIVAVAQETGLKIIPGDFQAFAEKTFVLPVQDERSGIRVDFIFSFTPYEKQAIARARTVLVKNTGVKFAAVEDLIIHKIFSGRPRDLEDVQFTITKNPDFDINYTRNWLKEFDATPEARDFLKTFEEILEKKGII